MGTLELHMHSLLDGNAILLLPDWIFGIIFEMGNTSSKLE
jgi:hypothetical protein